MANLKASGQRPASRHPLAEVRRLRAEITEALRERDEARAALLAQPDHERALRHVGAICYQAGRDSRADDYGHGFCDGAAALKRQIRNEVDDCVTEIRRWHVCCRDCRLAVPGKRRCDKRAGCPRCEIRTRETYGLPHPDDYAGGPADLRAAG